MSTSEEPQSPERRYYWPNKLGRIVLLSLDDVMGRKGLNAVLNLAKLRHLINNYPINNLDLGWSFEEMASLCQALEDMHGPLGGRGLAPEGLACTTSSRTLAASWAWATWLFGLCPTGGR
jgi:hypothetical protein